MIARRRSAEYKIDASVASSGTGGLSTAGLGATRATTTAAPAVGAQGTIALRPEKITLLEEGSPDPAGVHVEPGRVSGVIYAGVLTRYIVALDGGGELVVSRQNTEAPAASGDLRGARVRLAWRSGQAFTIPSGEGT